MLKIPPRQSGVRIFSNGLGIKTSTKLLVQDTGGDVWRGASELPSTQIISGCAFNIALSKFLSNDMPHATRGKSVLELASGTGLLGLSLALAPASARSVLLTDQEFMVGLLEENLCRNEGVLPEGCVCAAALDFRAVDLGPRVLEGAPFDVIVMSDVFYDEDIVEPLIRTLRKLCVLSLRDGRYPDMYLCVSHRTERIEGLFFSAARAFFGVDDLVEESSIRSELRRELIGVWRLRVRAGQDAGALVSGLALGSLSGYEAGCVERGVLVAAQTRGGHVSEEEAALVACVVRGGSAGESAVRAEIEALHAEHRGSRHCEPDGLPSFGERGRGQDGALQPHGGLQAGIEDSRHHLKDGNWAPPEERDSPSGEGGRALTGAGGHGSIDLEELD